MSYRYIGNKTRIADIIADVMSRYLDAGARVTDPMCGTASMSAIFRSLGYKVTASDLLTFAAHHARVRLLLDEAPPFDGLGISYLEALETLNALPGQQGLFWREYAPDGSPSAGCRPRMYFSAENAGRLDAIRRTLHNWGPRLSCVEEALLRHDLVLAANRVANIAGTYGHFRSRWSPAALRPLELLPTHPDKGSTDGHLVMQGPVEEVASEIQADACYLDPPYMKRQYAANYHILETLARGDEPEAIGVSGLRDWWDQYSDFCSKRNVADAFAATFEKMDCSLFFVSYSEDGLIDAGTMARMFADFGRVKRFDIPHQRFKSNTGGEGGRVTEYLYVVDLR
jgi:adenine-specific DNA-methyltransferase